MTGRGRLQTGLFVQLLEGMGGEGGGGGDPLGQSARVWHARLVQTHQMSNLQACGASCEQGPSGARGACRRAQIDMHTRPGALRLAVVPPQAGKALSAAELAWGHDVVLTTFSHLSAVWTQRGRASPLMQVHWLRIILDEVRASTTRYLVRVSAVSVTWCWPAP